MATFPYIPDYGATPELTPRRREVKFGDGYEQRSSDGLNPILPVWKLNFSVRSLTEATAIYSWLISNSAWVTAFDWAPPGQGVANGEYLGVGDGSRTGWAFTAAGRVCRYSGTPTVYRTDWQGSQTLYTTPRTNLAFNSMLVGGGAAPTSWTQPSATGTSAPGASTLGGPGTAYTQTATAQRPYLSQTFTLASNTTYCFSMLVEAVSGGLTAQDVLRYGAALPSGSMTWPVCSANPSGGASGVVTPGVLTAVIAIGVTGGATILRCGIGPNGVATGTIRFSHPQVEVGTTRTSFITTPAAASATVTDYTLNAFGISMSIAPVLGALISWSGSYTRKFIADAFTEPKPENCNIWSTTATFREVPA